jgi:hypothetical protein
MGFVAKIYEWSKGITLPSSILIVNMDEPNLFNQNQNIVKKHCFKHKTIKDIPTIYKLLKTEADFQWLVIINTKNTEICFRYRYDIT